MDIDLYRIGYYDTWGVSIVNSGNVMDVGFAVCALSATGCLVFTLLNDNAIALVCAIGASIGVLLMILATFMERT